MGPGAAAGFEGAFDVATWTPGVVITNDWSKNYHRRPFGGGLFVLFVCSIELINFGVNKERDQKCRWASCSIDLFYQL